MNTLSRAALWRACFQSGRVLLIGTRALEPTLGVAQVLSLKHANMIFRHQVCGNPVGAGFTAQPAVRVPQASGGKPSPTMSYALRKVDRATPRRRRGLDPAKALRRPRYLRSQACAYRTISRPTHFSS